MNSRPCPHRPHAVSTPGFVLLAASFVFLWSGATGAVAPASNSAAAPTQSEEERIELSPFVVRAEDERGYITRATTAGTRVRTDLRDLGAQIDVMPTAFLIDVAADRPEEAALYSLNIENEQDNPSRYGSGMQNNFERAVPGVSARGFGQAHGSGATRSREFFETNLPTHAYNTSTLAFSSGPNAILFGLGQPGGALTTALQRAHLWRNTASTRLRGDNQGSWSASADLNQVLRPGVLAARLAVLEDRGKLFLDPNYANESRYYGTLTFKPARFLEVRVHHENIEGRDTPLQYRLPRDEGSTWNASTDRLYSDALPASQRPLSQTQGNAQKPVFVFNDRLEPDSRITPVARNTQRVAPALVDWIAARDASFNRDVDNFSYSLSPDTIDRLGLPYDHVNIWGNTLVRTTDASIDNAFVELRPIRDLTLEAGFNRERFDGRQAAYGRSARYNFSRDIDAELPDGRPNPYAGHYFVGDEVWGWETRYQEKEARLTAHYSFDPAAHRSSLERRWLDLFGRQEVSLVYGDRTSIAIRQRAWRTWLQNTDGTTPSFITPASARPPTGTEDPRKTWLARNVRGVALMQYIDPFGAQPYMREIPGWDPVATYWTLPDPGRPGSTARAGMFEPESGGGTEAENFNRRIRGRVLVYQGRFWQDRFIATYGYRRDQVDVRNLVGSGDVIQNFSRADVEAGRLPSWVRSGGNFPWWTTLDWGSVNSRYRYNNSSKGLVFRPAGWHGGRLDWLSLSYNESTNNSVGALKLNVTNEPLPPVTGSGRDYGFRIDLLQGKLAFRANWFETSAQNTDGSAVSFGLRNNLYTLEERFAELQPANYRPDGWNPKQTSVQQYQTNADIENRGVEFTMAVAPTRQWNLRLAAGRNVSRQANVGVDWIRWTERRLSSWEKAQWYEADLSGVYRPVVGWKPDVNGVPPSNAELIAQGYTRIDPATGQPQRLPNGTIVTYRTKLGEGGQSPLTGWDNIAMLDDNPSDPTTMRQFYDRNIHASAIVPIRELDGQTNPNVRDWRVNFSTSYQFDTGILRGFGVGGSVRYRGRSVIGYAAKLLNQGTSAQMYVSDIARPYYNDPEYFFDGMVSFRSRTPLWGVNYRVQLNVRNLLDERGPYPVQSDSRGIGRVWSLYEPRTWILSCQFDL